MAVRYYVYQSDEGRYDGGSVPHTVQADSEDELKEILFRDFMPLNNKFPGDPLVVCKAVQRNRRHTAHFDSEHVSLNKIWKDSPIRWEN